MNRSIYTKLAISNLKNNRKSYIPYVLTAILTVMMYLYDGKSGGKFANEPGSITDHFKSECSCN